MFQLFKIRAFGEYISDTFTFLKLQGKNYFKNYLKFAFIALLLLLVSLSILGTFYFRVFSTMIGSTGGETFDNAFVSENGLMLGIGFIAVILIALYLSILNYCYPVYYLHLLGKNSKEIPQLKSIHELFKKDFGRLLLFGLLSVIIFGIVGIIAFAIAAVLSFVIIGIFIFILLVPFFITWYSLTLYYYIDKKQGFFDAFKHGFYTITNNFWNIVGASLCMLIIVYVMSMIVTMIPYMITIIGVIFGTQTAGSYADGTISVFVVLMVIIYCFSILVGMLLNHLLLIQTGLVYYSEREKLEYNTMQQSIDDIGKYE